MKAWAHGLNGGRQSTWESKMENRQLFTSFSKDMWDQFKAGQRPGPLHMLNLIRLRENAKYADRRASSGAEAYKTYSDMSAPVFQSLGGKIVWRGGHELMMVGPQAEVWDIAFIAEYPSVVAFIDMMKIPTYREALTHRQAGVLDSRLMSFSSQGHGTSFAG